MTAFDVEATAERLLAGEVPTIQEISYVCALSLPIFQKEENVITIDAPVVICGDVHGDFENVVQIFKIFGPASETRYTFVGDFVDRGPKSVQTIMLLLCYKILRPDSFFLIRGNHETSNITVIYGFYTEINRIYSDASPWNCFFEVFKALPLAAVIANSIFTVHGGLSPYLTNISEISSIRRNFEEPGMEASPLLVDLLWSDPFDGDGFAPSSRRGGVLFGEDVSRKFLHHNKLDLIVRGHEFISGGYKWSHGGRVLTVFSSPQYEKTLQEGAALEVESRSERQITTFKPARWETMDLSQAVSME